MGMYDYLEGRQVKCFPTGIVMDGEKYGFDAKVAFAVIGGSLKSFRIGDLVPATSPIYRYGKDFIIFDYEGVSEYDEDDSVCIKYEMFEIKDSRLVGIYDKKDTPEDIGNRTVIDIKGHRLNIGDITDVEKIVVEFVQMHKAYREAYSRNAPMFHEFLKSVENGNPKKELIEKHKEIMAQVRSETIDSFNDKWRSKDVLFSNVIGFFLHELLNLYNSNSLNTDKDVRGLLKQYKTQNQDKFNKEVIEYKEWANGRQAEGFIDMLLEI